MSVDLQNSSQTPEIRQQSLRDLNKIECMTQNAYKSSNSKFQSIHSFGVCDQIRQPRDDEEEVMHVLNQPIDTHAFNAVQYLNDNIDSRYQVLEIQREESKSSNELRRQILPLQMLQSKMDQKHIKKQPSLQFDNENEYIEDQILTTQNQF